VAAEVIFTARPQTWGRDTSMNLPNKLTISRLGLAGAFVLCFSVPIPFRFTGALLTFLAAAVTDYLDGQIARKRGLITDFGKLMDPLADKILTASAFICLCGVQIPDLRPFPEWAAIAIISREFLITGLRSLAASKGVVLPAERLGKHKTLWQMIAVIYFLLLLSLSDWTEFPAWLQTFWQVGLVCLVPTTVLLTVYSGLAYLRRHWDLIQTD